MTDPTRRNDRGRPLAPSRRAKQLLHEVNSRIALMEVVLGNLHRRIGDGRESDREQLRTKLTACYLVRKGLERGHYNEARALKDLLRRVEIRLEHKRFEPFGTVREDEYQYVDYDELTSRLFGS